METRREFLKKALLLSGALGLSGCLEKAIARAAVIDPEPGSSFLDAEHVVILMQENRSFDHMFGTLRGVRGFDDPRAFQLANGNLVWLQTNAIGETYAPFRLDIKNTRATWLSSLPHTRESQVDAWNQGHHDQWLKVKQYPAHKEVPMTLGYYTREDLPFYYALADAFTVCDQHFSGILTGTMPNRSLFWTGKIREDAASRPRLHNEDFSAASVSWSTFPEELQKHGISWKFYQNEISANKGFTALEESWLSNFGCNPLEFFSQYYAEGSPLHSLWTLKKVGDLGGEIKSVAANNVPPAALPNKLPELQKLLAEAQKATDDLAAQKSEPVKNSPPGRETLFSRAFTTNSGDPDYRKLEPFHYTENGKPQSVPLPKGDILHQFRRDVQEGRLPAVSWLCAPQNFSDHPESPWYGAWYVSEVMSILTQNPEVWKKTIFILTYDENDGYFDHVPPYVAPDPARAETGAVSPGCYAHAEYVSPDRHPPKGEAPWQAPAAPVGLGFRVPMIVASPWSRGGWVNSQLFEHTSVIQFLEAFLGSKTGKPVWCANISPWRRAIAGNLTSCFREFQPKTPGSLPFVKRDPFVASIEQAKNKAMPSGYQKLGHAEIAAINAAPLAAPGLPRQEKGVRPSCPLPYQLYANGALSPDRSHFGLSFRAGKEVFGDTAKGAPFNVSVFGLNPGAKGSPSVQHATYSVAAGEKIEAQWPLAKFANGAYHLSIHGPNGFYREYRGNAGDPPFEVTCQYQAEIGTPGILTGGLELLIVGAPNRDALLLEITDNAYAAKPLRQEVSAGVGQIKIALNLEKSFGWYDFNIKVPGFDQFSQRYAGRVETGHSSFSDPLIGGGPQTTAKPA